MKKFLLFSFTVLIVSFVTALGQDKLFSIGYGKTFVTNDSSTFSFTLDFNRIPGKPETSGGYIVNDAIKNTQWGYYIKPSMDINIGSSISSAPNNISIALPGGLVYDFPQLGKTGGIISLYLEGAPEFISDRSFNNMLYYFSIGPYIKYENNAPGFLFDLQTGISDANGFRNQKALRNDYYGRLTIPLYFKIIGWKAKDKKEFNRIQLTNTLKYNIIYSDDFNITKDKNYISQLDSLARIINEDIPILICGDSGVG